jgi:hypothetical protein
MGQADQRPNDRWLLLQMYGEFRRDEKKWETNKQKCVRLKLQLLSKQSIYLENNLSFRKSDVVNPGLLKHIEGENKFNTIYKNYIEMREGMGQADQRPNDRWLLLQMYGEFRRNEKCSLL